MITEGLELVAGQQGSDVAVFVVDENSRDPREQKHLARFHPNVRLVRNTSGLAIAQSRNRGAGLGRNPIIAFLDAVNCSRHSRPASAGYVDAVRRHLMRGNKTR
jgi:hypothetical protein